MENFLINMKFLENFLMYENISVKIISLDMKNNNFNNRKINN